VEKLTGLFNCLDDIIFDGSNYKIDLPVGSKLVYIKLAGFILQDTTEYIYYNNSISLRKDLNIEIGDNITVHYVYHPLLATSLGKELF
jgi:anaerobic ribonucleoside-triphosphate reductase